MTESELQQLVDQARQGLRVVLFPPGGWTLPVLMVPGALALLPCIFPLRNLLAPDLTQDQRIAVQFGSIAFVLLTYSLPGCLVMSGWKQFAHFIRGYHILIASISLLQIIACLFIPRFNYLPTLFVALASSGFFYYLTTTHSFWMLCEYMYLLKRKNPRAHSPR